MIFENNIIEKNRVYNYLLTIKENFNTFLFEKLIFFKIMQIYINYSKLSKINR